MLLEYAQRRFERMEHRLSNLQGVANIQRVLKDYALASDVGLHFGNVTVGLGKMAANHRSKDTGILDWEKSKPRLGRCTSAKRGYGGVLLLANDAPHGTPPGLLRRYATATCFYAYAYSCPKNSN